MMEISRHERLIQDIEIISIISIIAVRAIERIKKRGLLADYDFVFTGTKTQQNRQVGNAVPPLLGYYLGKALLNIINKEETNE